MHILISGAGIAGPALAWFLSQAGIRATVVEKAKALFPHGQNVDIQGSAVRVIQKMGLLETVRSHNTKEKGTQIVHQNGKPIAVFPLLDGPMNASLTSEYEILRGDLAAILYDHTKHSPLVSYRFNTSVKRVIENKEDAPVQVELDNGLIESYDLLVAADGQWSRIRKECFDPSLLRVKDTDMYATYWTLPRLPRDNDLWNIYIGLRSRLLSIRPDPYGSIRACITCMPTTASEKQAWETVSRQDRHQKEELTKAHFKDAGWEAERLLDSISSAEDFYFQAIKQIKLARWYSGRVVCLGDAAHAPTPLTGQGTSLAILGAYVLGGELSKLKEGENPMKALEAYDNAFRQHVEEQQAIPPGFPTLVHPGSPLKRFLLQNTLWLVSKVVHVLFTTPWIAKRLMPYEQKEGEVEYEDFKLPLYEAFEGRAERQKA